MVWKRLRGSLLRGSMNHLLDYTQTLMNSLLKTGEET